MNGHRDTDSPVLAGVLQEVLKEEAQKYLIRYHLRQRITCDGGFLGKLIDGNEHVTRFIECFLRTH